MQGLDVLESNCLGMAEKAGRSDGLGQGQLVAGPERQRGRPTCLQGEAEEPRAVETGSQDTQREGGWVTEPTGVFECEHSRAEAP